MRLKQVTLIFSTLFAICTAAKTLSGSLPGACPKKFEYLEDVDETLLDGTWYNQYQTNSTLADCDGSCWTTFFLKTLVSFCCQLYNRPFCGDQVGTFVVESYQNSTRKIENQEASVYFLDVDNEDVVVFFYCDEEMGLRVYALSRSISGSDNFNEEQLFQLLRKNDIDPKVVDKVSQGSDCFYIKNNERFYKL